MGREYSGKHGPYYMRSKKILWPVVRKYIGGELAGETAAQEDAARRAKGLAERQALNRQRARQAELEGVLDAFCSEAEYIARTRSAKY